ncbi:Hpt domain-containing protein [Methylobacterium sp. JK268]
MTDAFLGAADEDPRLAALPVLDRRAHAETVDLVGEAGAARLRGRLAEQVREAFRDGADRERLALEAHALVSTAGLLGCARLSEACRDLEVAAKADAALPDRLAAARRIRDLTAEALRALDEGSGEGHPR